MNGIGAEPVRFAESIEGEFSRATVFVVPLWVGAGARVKIVVVFGTRPEAIKLAPVIAELRRRPGMIVHVVTTAQHRELVEPVLRVFAIAPDRDLAVMQPRQTLAELSGRVLVAMDALLCAEPPDMVIVQGDTTSAFVCASGWTPGSSRPSVRAGQTSRWKA